MALLQEITLDGTWELRDEILTHDLASARHLSHVRDGWIATPVPGDIHQGLIAAGRIREPLLGLNSFDCRWTESGPGGSGRDSRLGLTGFKPKLWSSS